MPVNFATWLRSRESARPGRSKVTKLRDLPPTLRDGEIFVVFQPIIDLEQRAIMGYEALLRANSKAYKGPVRLFEEAVESGYVGALGRAVRELAIEGCPFAPLFLNIHPAEFNEGWLVQPDDPIFCHEHKVYLEITESVPLSHFDQCHGVLEEIRSKGLLLAVDDLGAGYSNLKYIADLAPEVVKLDRELIVNLASDTRLQKLVRAIVHLCNDLGARVVAEGIERADELIGARIAGAHYGQGYVFAKPAYPPPRNDAVQPALDVLTAAC